MLRRSLLVAIATTMCCLALGGVARATADILQFYHAGDAWIGAMQILSLAGSLIGFASFLYCLVLKPERPPGWEARHPLSLERLGPVATFLALLAGGAIAAVLLPEAPARLARRLLGDTTQIAFALVVWESRWLWKQYAEASSAG